MSEIKREEALGIGVIDLLVSNGSLKGELNKLKESEKLYSKWWRDEQESHKKTQESLLDTSSKMYEQINKLEDQISLVYSNLTLIISKSKEKGFDLKKCLKKVEETIISLEKK